MIFTLQMSSQYIPLYISGLDIIHFSLLYHQKLKFKELA